MSQSAVVHARIDRATKTATEKVLNTLGMTPTEAIRLFYRQIAIRKSFPIELHVPNKLTASVLSKSNRALGKKTFNPIMKTLLAIACITALSHMSYGNDATPDIVGNGITALTKRGATAALSVWLKGSPIENDAPGRSKILGALSLSSGYLWKANWL